MRKQLSAKRELHKVERVVLLTAFTKVRSAHATCACSVAGHQRRGADSDAWYGGWAPSCRCCFQVLRVPRIAAQQKVSAEQFAKVWHTLGLEVSAMQAAAVFAKYGQDKDGLMPVMVLPISNCEEP